MARIPATILSARRPPPDPTRALQMRESMGMGRPLTPNMRLVLQHMETIGGNPVTYRQADIVVSTGLSRGKVTTTLGGLFVRNKVEKIDTGAGVLWRTKVA